MILVTGATGFIGRHVVTALVRSGNGPIRALTRQSLVNTDTNPQVQYIQADINNEDSLRSALEPGATVVNLAYSNTNNLQDAVSGAEMMANTFAQGGIKRVIHCSSISVYGRVSGLVTENVSCVPLNGYGQAKLAVERALIEHARGRFELIILRPTEVFGQGGKTLFSLLQSLTNKHPLVNYIRTSLFGSRRTHLLPVETLVAALQFFCADPRQYSNAIFNVSADEHKLNNFRAIEDILKNELSLPAYKLTPVPIPSFILRSVLLAAGRATIDDQVLYSSENLQKTGFQPVCDFEEALRAFARDYQEKYISAGAPA